MATTTPNCTSINVGEQPTSQGFVQMPPIAGPPIHYGAPPPHVHHFMKRKLRQGCCCLIFLILLNLIIVIQAARNVTKLSRLFSSNSEVMFMPGGFRPFCSDLCVNLCFESDTNNNEMNVNTDMNNENMNNDNNNLPISNSMNKNITSGFSCELKSCLNSCSQYFEINNNYENNHGFDDREHHHKHHHDHDDHDDHDDHHDRHGRHHHSRDEDSHDDDSSENNNDVFRANNEHQ